MARKANVFSFTKVIAEKRADVARVREEVTTLASQADAFAPAFAIVNALAKRGEALGFGKRHRVEPSSFRTWDGQVVNRLIVSICEVVDNLKEGKVPAMIEAAESLGFEVTGSRDYAAEWGAERTFRFELNVNGVEVILRLEAEIKDGSEACKRVQTGTKLEEVATYEIVCA